VVGSSSERLLTTDGQSSSVHQVSEELPSGRDLEALEASLLGNDVDGSTGRHGPGETLDTALEIRDGLLRPVGNDGNGVRWGDESALSVDHVSVTVTVRGRAELDVVLLHDLDERVSVREVRIRVEAAEVGQRGAVLDGRLVQAELLDEDGSAVRASDTVQGVEENGRLGRSVVQPVLDHVKVEDLLEERDVVGDGIDNGDLERAVLELAELGQVKLGSAMIRLSEVDLRPGGQPACIP